jgi:NADPH:quinone reductase-like Zn-dependent oxidoreductase
VFEEADRLGVRVTWILVDADRAVLRTVAELAEAGTLRPAIAGTFPFTEAAEAHRLGETGRTTGKLVLLME